MKHFRKLLAVIFAAVSLIVCSIPADAATVKYRVFAKMDGAAVTLKVSADTRYAGYNWDSGLPDNEGNFCYYSPISDFFDNNGIYTIAYCDDSKVYICRTNSSLKITKTISFKKRLPRVGGVICGDDGTYYVAYGDNDEKGKKGVKTVDIAKYDHSGKFLKAYEYIPKAGDKDDYEKYTGEWGIRKAFSHGNCAMAESSGVLVVHLARVMYNGHQASAVLAVNTKDMSRNTDIFTYTSHSFNQRVIVNSEGRFIFADHGDSFPRGFCINNENDKGITPFSFAGDLGSNETGAQLCGIFETSKGYMLIGSSVKGNDLDDNKQLFVQTVSKDLKKVVSTGSSRTITKNGSDKVTDTGIKWLTDYDDHSVRNISAAYIGDDKILVMFEKHASGGFYNYTFSETLYGIINADGKVVQKPISLGRIRTNSAEELKYNSKDKCVYWTTAEGDNKAVIHRLYTDGTKVKISQISDRYYTGKQIKPTVIVKVGDTRLVQGEDYTLSYKNNILPTLYAEGDYDPNYGEGYVCINTDRIFNQPAVIISGKGKYAGLYAENYFNILLKAPELKLSGKELKVSADGYMPYRSISEETDYRALPDRYVIFCSINGGEYEKIAVENVYDSADISCRIEDFIEWGDLEPLKSGSTYRFKVQGYSEWNVEIGGVRETIHIYTPCSKAVTYKA